MPSSTRNILIGLALGVATGLFLGEKLVLGAVTLMPFAFPKVESASFFSHALVEVRPPLDLVALYIPSNPFHSLANNSVPSAAGAGGSSVWEVTSR